MPTLSASQQALQRQFKAATNTKALPPFPPIFTALKQRLPDIADDLDAAEKSIADWVKSLQTTLT